jgi:hypothetical protein
VRGAVEARGDARRLRGEAAEDRFDHDSLAILDPMATEGRCKPTVYRIRDAWPETGVRTPAIVEVDNPTPIVLSYGNSVIRGIHGSVVPSQYTRCSLSRGTLSVGAASRRSAVVYR